MKERGEAGAGEVVSDCRTATGTAEQLCRISHLDGCAAIVHSALSI
jgi:hypothetical protein